MKVCIPSFGRAGTIRTPGILPKSWPVEIIVNTLEEALWYEKNPKLADCQLIVSYQENGIARTRNWILDNRVELDEWFLMIDDNVRGFEAVKYPHYQKEQLNTMSLKPTYWHMVFENRISPEEFANICEESIAVADSLGIYLIGFATVQNPIFRNNKWKTWSYVSQKACLIRKSFLRFEEWMRAREEYQFMAVNYEAFGKVLVNQYVYPVANHFEEGGIGSKNIRLHFMRKETEYVVEKWPTLFQYRNGKKGCPEKTEVVVRPRKENANGKVENIRKKNRALKNALGKS